MRDLSATRTSPMSNAQSQCHLSQSRKKNAKMTNGVNLASKKTADIDKKITEVIQDVMIKSTMAVLLVQLGKITILVIAVTKKNLTTVDHAAMMMTLTDEGETVKPTFKT